MGYKVKWIEDNLGVSRKALRNFEALELIPKNEDGKYRDYSDEDIERIWAIRLLQGIGFSLREIKSLSKDESLDFETSLEGKIKELEKKKEEIERHLGYAKTIKLTGRIPSKPKKIGSVTFNEFCEKALNEWNINSDSQIRRCEELVDLILNKPEDEFTDTDIEKLFTFLQDCQENMSNLDLFMKEKVILQQILKRKEKGTTDTEVQLLIKMLYENRMNCSHELANLSVNQFVRFEASGYVSGDVVRFREREYGKEGCLFIADAIAVFGGYSCYDEVED